MLVFTQLYLYKPLMIRAASLFRSLKIFKSLKLCQPMLSVSSSSLAIKKPNFGFSFIKNKRMDPQTEEQFPKQKTVTCVSAKDMKKIVRPMFEKNPEQYYPVETFKKIGFTRAQCKCGHFFWRKSEKTVLCGDQKCIGKYTFIGEGVGIGRKGEKLTYQKAWQGFKKSLTSTRIPCTAIDRYPVVARWRNDVDYVAAGIFCFQPYCVTGELEPPANPLICPQFCLRFNDLDNIGLTGRHYSGFIMLGIQVFNKPNDYKFFKQQCVQFNYRWLTEELGIDPEEITFIEDVWAGGGNLGPSIEYFVGGLEVGNMVFMQYRYHHDGSFDDLSVKVIDVGIGLERVPWLINGTPTSYIDTFSKSYEFLNSKLQVPLQNKVWQTMGPYSCKLDIDESQNIDATWQEIAKIISLPVADIKRAIIPIRDQFIILDHTRTILMIISDGGLPSNTGGGSNCRNILRRVFATLKKNDWWSKIGGVDGLLELFEMHKKDLEPLYGPFPEYKSFGDIIKIQHERWSTTQDGQKKKIEQLVNKKKGKLTLDDWIMAIQTWGIPADVIAQVCGTEVPGNLYNEIDRRAQIVAKAQQAVLYDTINFPETHNLYYENHRLYDFEAKIVGVLQNVQDKTKGKNIVLFDKSAFYPTSGGQVNDLGTLQIETEKYNVIDVEKVGKCFLHHLDRPVTDEVVGKTVRGIINEERRNTLRSFHTGTHIVFAAARRVLGPHIWQHGAKKTENYAHLDITHYSSISQETEMLIQNEANKIILEGHKIRKYFENKKEAEQQFGFSLYQGGIVPGDTIRVVNIQGVDVEACCGTHADNTSEVGWIKLIKSARVSDGILRLYYMAGKKVMKALNEQTLVINQLKDLWGVKLEDIVGTATRFFNETKKYEKINDKQKMALLGMQVRYIEQQKGTNCFVVPSFESEPRLYFSSLNTHLAPIVISNKTVIFISDKMLYGIVASPQHLDVEKLKALLLEDVPKQKKEEKKEDVPKQKKEDAPKKQKSKKSEKEQQKKQQPKTETVKTEGVKQVKQESKKAEKTEENENKFIIKKGLQASKGKEKIKNENGVQINFNGKIKEKKIIEYLTGLKYELLK